MYSHYHAVELVKNSVDYASAAAIVRPWPATELLTSWVSGSHLLRRAIATDVTLQSIVDFKHFITAEHRKNHAS